MGIKDLILAAADSPPLKKVTVKEWQTDIYLKVMTGTERDTWENELYADGHTDRANFRARFLCHVICDEQGAKVFEPSEAAALGAKSGKVIDRLYGIASKLNALTPEDEEELKKS